MIFRQLFDHESCTYTYLLADETSRECILIDPVLEKVDRYIQLLEELDLKLVKAVDTHLHADHITALGALRDRTKCITVMGEQSQADVTSVRIKDGDRISIEGLSLEVIYTPGHTDDSYCYKLDNMLFTGDTLLIRGTGRTDFQHGNAADQYDSIFNKILTLPDNTLIYPGHDYKGDTVSTVAEERTHNPRLQSGSRESYIELMDNLGLANPKMMDIAVPNNMKIGLSQDEIEKKGWAVSASGAQEMRQSPNSVFVDLRDDLERAQEGIIPGSLHTPYARLERAIKPGGELDYIAKDGKQIVFYCAFGERSAMAVEAAQNEGIKAAIHLSGGMSEWRANDGQLEYPEKISPLEFSI